MKLNKLPNKLALEIEMILVSYLHISVFRTTYFGRLYNIFELTKKE